MRTFFEEKFVEYCLFVLMVSEDRKKGRKIKKIIKIYPGLSGSCFAAIHKKLQKQTNTDRQTNRNKAGYTAGQSRTVGQERKCKKTLAI